MEGRADNEHNSSSGTPSEEVETAQGTIEDAETIEELEEAAKSELRTLIPDLQLNLKNGDIRVCRPALKRFVELTHSYETQCHKITVKPLEKMAYASVTADGKELTLNTPYFVTNPSSSRDAEQKIVNSIQEGIAGHKHPVIRDGEELSYIVDHEFAHSLSTPQVMDAIEDLWQEYIAKFPKGTVNPEDSSYISGYASQSKDEFLAESYSSAQHADNPSPIAAEVFKRINRISMREKDDN